MDFEWGSDAAALGRQPDLITGADVVYEEHCFPALLASIEALSASHTISFIAYRIRGADPYVVAWFCCDSESVNCLAAPGLRFASCLQVDVAVQSFLMLRCLLCRPRREDI